jgi:hypothetical protein
MFPIVDDGAKSKGVLNPKPDGGAATPLRWGDENAVVGWLEACWARGLGAGSKTLLQMSAEIRNALSRLGSLTESSPKAELDAMTESSVVSRPKPRSEEIV